MSKTISIILACAILFSSCSSTTLIQSRPSGANLYLNDEFVGTTPYTHTDTKIVGSTTIVLLEKEGFEPFHTSFSRNEEADAGAIIGGILFLFPFLWTMKYKPSRIYELRPEYGFQSPEIMQDQQNQTKSKTERLRELKQLLDEDLITKEEYERARKKILEETEN